MYYNKVTNSQQNDSKFFIKWSFFLNAEMFPHCFVSNLERRLHNLKYPENEEDMIFCVQRFIYFCIPVVYTEYTQAINSQIKVLNA